MRLNVATIVEYWQSINRDRWCFRVGLISNQVRVCVCVCVSDYGKLRFDPTRVSIVLVFCHL